MENQENKEVDQMQIRVHRGGLGESVATMKTIDATMEAVKQYMCEHGGGLPFSQKELDSVKIMPYIESKETRIEGWEGNTWLVTYFPQNGSGYAVFGMCSKLVGGDDEVVFDSRFASLVGEQLQKPPTTIRLDYTAERAQNYVRDFLLQLINSGLAGNVMENSLKLVLNHRAFERYTTTTREERETLPTEIELDLRDFECRLADARFVFETVMKMVADPKGIEKNFELMRTKRDIPIFNEAATTLGCNTKYYIGLRGKWGWLHLYNGN